LDEVQINGYHSDLRIFFVVGVQGMVPVTWRERQLPFFGMFLWLQRMLESTSIPNLHTFVLKNAVCIKYKLKRGLYACERIQGALYPTKTTTTC